MQKSIINKHNPLEYYIIYTNCKKMQKDNLKLYNKNPAKMETLKSYICEFCAKIYSDAATLSRHRNHYCSLVPDDVKTKMIAKQQRRKKKDKPGQIPVDKSVNITNIQQHKINVDKQQINITFNICGSDVPLDVIKSIKELNKSSMDKLREYIPDLLQPLCSENLIHILDDSNKIIDYFNDYPEETFEILLNDIHKFDENRNFAVPNVKFAIVQYVNSNFDISKRDKSELIEDIQLHMHKLYRTLFSKYKSQIRPRYHTRHELFIQNMLRRYGDIVAEFKCQQKAERDAEIRRLTADAKTRDEDFDDRSILAREEKECSIPDYNKITREIIETYLTTNSQINVQSMNKHKDKVSAIKSAITKKEPKTVLRLEDLEMEERQIQKQRRAQAKIAELASKMEILELPPLEQNTITDTLIDDKLIEQLEHERGND